MTATRVTAAAAVLGLGVAAPGLAAALATAVALLVAAWAVLSGLRDHRDVVARPVRPFGDGAPAATVPYETPDVAELAREIADSRRGIPSRTAAQLREIARGRFLDRHQLDLADPADRLAAADRMSDGLRAVVVDDRADDVAVRRLHELLDELERS